MPRKKVDVKPFSRYILINVVSLKILKVFWNAIVSKTGIIYNIVLKNCLNYSLMVSVSISIVCGIK